MIFKNAKDKKYKNTIIVLSDEISSLRSELNELRRKGNSYDLDELLKDKEELIKENIALRNDYSKLEETINLKAEKFKDSSNQIASLTKEKEDELVQAKQMAKKSEELSKKLDDAVNENVKLKKEIISLEEAKTASLNSNKDPLKKGGDDAKEIVLLKARINEKEKSKLNLAKKIDQLAKELEQNQAEISELLTFKKRFGVLEQKYNQTILKLNDTNALLNTKSAENEMLFKENKELKNDSTNNGNTEDAIYKQKYLKEKSITDKLNQKIKMLEIELEEAYE